MDTLRAAAIESNIKIQKFNLQPHTVGYARFNHKRP